MIVNKHSQNNKQVLAICDNDLLGKVIEENDLILDLSSEFYSGEEVSENQLKELIKTSYIINAVGEKTINFLKQEKLVDVENIKFIGSVPHVQVVIDNE